MISSSSSTASAFSIFAITRAVRAGLLDPTPELADVVGGAHEGERDEVDAELEREREVVEVLRRQRRDRQRHAGKVHALVRADGAADDDGADGARALDPLDAQPHVAVVDQHVVAGLEHLADRRRAHRQVDAGRVAVRADHDLVAAREHERLAADRRRGASALAGRRSARAACRARAAPRGRAARSRACSSCVPCEKFSRAASMPAVDELRRSGRAERARSSRRSSCGEESAAGDTRSREQSSVSALSARARKAAQTSRDSAAARRRAPPRSAGAGCTSRRGPCEPARRS